MKSFATVMLDDGDMIVKHFDELGPAKKYADHIIRHGVEFEDEQDITTFYPSNRITKVVVEPERES
jgi:hypothetical protein